MTKTQPSHKKLSRAKVMWQTPSGTIVPLSRRGKYGCRVVVSYCHAPAKAKQLVNASEFLWFPEDDKAEVMAKAAWHHLNKKTKWEDTNAHARTHFRLVAFAVLAAMGMGGASK